MNITKLNGIHLYHAFVSGAKRLINEKIFLNKINVFPSLMGILALIWPV